jgi:hypothetical protein
MIRTCDTLIKNTRRLSLSVEVAGVKESENGCIIKQILLPRGNMKYGCAVGVFEEHSILFRA